jgi:hypothetical protein
MLLTHQTKMVELVEVEEETDLPILEIDHISIETNKETKREVLETEAHHEKEAEIKVHRAIKADLQRTKIRDIPTKVVEITTNQAEMMGDIQGADLKINQISFRSK